MRIPVKDDKEVKKEDQITGADVLFDPIKSIVFEYLGYQNHPNTYTFQSRLTLLGNITPFYATQIAHNLLWHIDIDQTLELAKVHPESLLIEVEIRDPHGQRIRGTPLQIVAAAGDTNPRFMKDEEKDYGLVERLRSCFPENSEDFDKQIAAWFLRDTYKEETQKTMAPYVQAIMTLCRDIIESKEISEDVPFETLLKLPIAVKFRKALIPDPNHVVTSGLLFDLQIFVDFFEIWRANVNNDELEDMNEDEKSSNLGAANSLKSDLFAAIVYTSLQARVQRVDLEIFKKGIGNVIEDDHYPDQIDFSKGIPEDLKGLGDTFFFIYYGTDLSFSSAPRWAIRSGFADENMDSSFYKLIAHKHPCLHFIYYSSQDISTHSSFV